MQNKAKWTLVLSLLVCQLAHSQINSGTVIIFQLVNDKFIMASDSRMIFEGKPSDGNCKIAAFRDHVVFGVTGGPKYVPGPLDSVKSWDAMLEAKRAVDIFGISNQDSASRVTAIANAWATNMQTNWQILLVSHPDLVRKFAADENGGLTNGIFAATASGRISLTMRGLVLKNDLIAVETPTIVGTCGGGPCASGKTDIFNEYTQNLSKRAKDEKWTFSSSLLDRTIPEMIKIVRLVDLSIAYDSSGTIGGPIDAIELNADGSMKWYQRPNCKETYQ